MTKNTTLSELTERRARFRVFADLVDAELRAERERRLATEKNAILTLMHEAWAKGATYGELKRAYGTKDHRTVRDIIESGTSEINAIKARIEQQASESQSHWFTIDWGQHNATVTVDGFQAVFSWWEDEETGDLTFITDEALYPDNNFDKQNKAVALLDGKTEKDSASARELAEAISAGRP